MNHEIFADIEDLDVKNLSRNEFLLTTTQIIQKHFPMYNWVGYYFLESDGKLHVGPYVGKTTPHEIIELDKGICGAAVSRQETIIVDDVNADPRYLSCSLETRSEIVIPLKIGGEIAGELDIDSSRPAAFSQDDKAILEEVVKMVERVLEKVAL